jgi:hypothetical protein
MGQYYQNEAAHAPDRYAERKRKLRQFNRYPEQELKAAGLWR